MAIFPERLRTDRLLLRLWEPTDAPAVTEAVTASADHLRPWMAWIAHEPLTDAERVDNFAAWRKLWETGREAHYGIFLDGAVIGSAGLHSRIGPGGLDIGYWIHVDHVRRGYAAEASRALTSAAFAIPGIERVEIHHDVANEASGGVPRSLGYRRAADVEVENGTDAVWVITSDQWAEHS